MKPADVRKNLGKTVFYSNSSLYLESKEYIFNAATIRINCGRIVWQAELKEPKLNSVLIVNLSEVSV